MPKKKAKAPASETPQIPPVQPEHRGDYKQHLKEPWLASFRKTGTILAACQLVPVDRKTILTWRERDPEFAEAFNDAELSITEQVENSALSRAANGDSEPMIRNGRPVTDAAGRPIMVRRFSDQLQMFFLRTRNRKRYGDKVEHDVRLELVGKLVGDMVDAIRSALPNNCPACKTNLHLPEKVAAHLLRISEAMAAGGK